MFLFQTSYLSAASDRERERERETDRQIDRERYQGGENMIFLPSVVPKCKLPVEMSKCIYVV